jgi:hypothetical protein
MRPPRIKEHKYAIYMVISKRAEIRGYFSQMPVLQARGGRKKTRRVPVSEHRKVASGTAVKLGGIAHAKLIVDVGPVPVNGPLADVQLAGDLPAVLAGQHQVEDLFFAFGMRKLVVNMVAVLSLAQGDEFGEYLRSHKIIIVNPDLSVLGQQVQFLQKIRCNYTHFCTYSYFFIINFID